MGWIWRERPNSEGVLKGREIGLHAQMGQTIRLNIYTHTQLTQQKFVTRTRMENG